MMITLVGDDSLTLGGRLARGDRVDLLFGMQDGGMLPARITDAFVLDIQQRHPRSTVTLAFLSGLDARQAAALARGQVAVLRRPPR